MTTEYDFKIGDEVTADNGAYRGVIESFDDWLSKMAAVELLTEPPQPAPMTRAARVLAKMEEDPYLKQPEVRDMERHKAELRNEAARLRMARMSLDRPLDAEQARWERLVCAVHPVTGRAVRR